uniref:(northern house mosquito) hypothetical protein n=1 Tax=Culex pipiens TaxID=7175 RepID=A0A8D8K4J4_CULPI
MFTNNYYLQNNKLNLYFCSCFGWFNPAGAISQVGLSSQLHFGRNGRRSVKLILKTLNTVSSSVQERMAEATPYEITVVGAGGSFRSKSRHTTATGTRSAAVGSTVGCQGKS